MVEGESFSVLSVCTGNICRSPVLEFILRGGFEELGWSDFHVGSAGLSAVVGAPIEPVQREFLHELGIDSRAFRARQITTDHVRSAQLVLTMTREQRDEVVSRFPSGARKVFTLVEFHKLVTDEKFGELRSEIENSSAPSRYRKLVGELARHRTLVRLSEADDIDDPYRLDDDVQRSITTRLGEVAVGVVSGLSR